MTDRPDISPWWKRGVVYQIYPRSFQDSNGDGVGDLPGLLSRLDYLQNLGVDAVWVSPVYPSPMADFGYDVSNYCDIDPVFGRLDDFDRLVEAAHKRQMKIILDFVPNHTSDQHPWFKDSRSSRASAKRDWYLWRDGASDGAPPNNWRSNFGGSAWTFDAATGQYYYHAFLKEQPDLNWRNPAVRRAMYDVLRFWMRRGVDGFRVDVIWHLMKDPEWRDNPPNPSWTPRQPEIDRYLQIHSAGHADVLGVVAEMRRVIDEFPDRVLIGEIYLPLERLVAYYGPGLNGAQLPFNFHLIFCDWNGRSLASLVEKYEALLPPGAWPNWVLGNHDQPRVATRLGPDQARVAMMLLLTLRGTPTLYQGDELGLENGKLAPEDVHDPQALNEPGIAAGRDPQRTPMPWSQGENAGFTTGRPWLPVGQSNAAKNVAAQAANPASFLALTHDLLAMRRLRLAFQTGAYRTLHAEDSLFAFERVDGGETTIVALNVTEREASVSLGDRDAQILLSTHLDRVGERATGAVRLRANEGLVLAPLAETPTEGNNPTNTIDASGKS